MSPQWQFYTLFLITFGAMLLMYGLFGWGPPGWRVQYGRTLFISGLFVIVPAIISMWQNWWYLPLFQLVGAGIMFWIIRRERTRSKPKREVPSTIPPN